MEIPSTVRKCLDRFKILLADDSRYKEEIVDVFGRFRVWAGNVSAHTSGKRSLRYRLRDSSELTEAVLAYLKELLDILGRANNELPSIDEDPSEEDDEEGDEELFEVDARQSPAQQALEEVDDIISGLMRISMALRNPARNDQVRYADTALTKLFEPRDIEHVRMKYPHLPHYLAQRLGKSISQHRQYFKYRREHNEKLAQGIDDLKPDDDETRQSTVATALVKPGIQPGSFHEDSDNGSIGTATSYAPSESSETLLRPPPRPEKATDGLPFECNICFHIVNAPNERLWRQHVYEDLPPYTCMHEDCQSVIRQFSRRSAWRRHTLDHYRYWVCPYGCEDAFASAEDHRRHMNVDHHEDLQDVMLKSLSKSCARDSGFQFAQCPFCYKETSNRNLWFKHVGHHLEQLALFALPTHIFAHSTDHEENDPSDVDEPAEQDIESDNDAAQGISAPVFEPPGYQDLFLPVRLEPANMNPDELELLAEAPRLFSVTPSDDADVRTEVTEAVSSMSDIIRDLSPAKEGASVADESGPASAVGVEVLDIIHPTKDPSVRDRHPGLFESNPSDEAASEDENYDTTPSRTTSFSENGLEKAAPPPSVTALSDHASSLGASAWEARNASMQDDPRQGPRGEDENTSTEDKPEQPFVEMLRRVRPADIEREGIATSDRGRHQAIDTDQGRLAEPQGRQHRAIDEEQAADDFASSQHQRQPIDEDQAEWERDRPGGSGRYRSRSRGHSPTPTFHIYNRAMEEDDDRDPSRAFPLVPYPPTRYPPHPQGGAKIREQGPLGNVERERRPYKVEETAFEQKERRETYLEYKQREQDAKDEEERKYDDFVRLQAEKKEKMEREATEEEENFQTEMRKRLSNMGYTQQTIDILVDEEIPSESRKQVESTHDTTALAAGSDSHPPDAPVYPKVHRKYLSVETLNYYHIPWEYDHLDPEYIIILRDMDQRGTDLLFEHTSRLRRGKVSLELADETKPELKLLHLVTGALALNVLEYTSATPLDKPAQEQPANCHLPSTADSKHLRYEYSSGNEKRDAEYEAPDTSAKGYYRQGGFSDGNPISSTGKGGPLSGGTNRQIDLQSPSNLGQETTDAGNVPNLKWRFSDSKTRLLSGGWVRQQLITDLPSSKDIFGAQQHLKKGAVRELHWHKVAEWGYVYAGRVAVSAVDENGKNQYDVLEKGDVWYFPKGAAHGVEGLDDDNEFLLVFDEGDFEAPGTTFNVDDWITHTPRDILARSLGVNESELAGLQQTPYIVAATNSSGGAGDEGIDHPYGNLADGNGSYVKHSKDVAPIVAPGGGGTIQIFDSRSFPISKTLATSVVTLKPGALRELHWHPTAEEWVYFVSGQGRATIFAGNARSRTFDFSAGDTAVFPDNSGHYVENTSQTEDLVWIEVFKADRVADISLTQWLALTPAPYVAQVLNVSVATVKKLKKEKQLILA
ncbi:unnamed protein product [Zymoseptoria tritici ST99CH_1A5]|uniref:C2H2-type domain-containing protein n=1 Tax=Zymoseptoria tritici ST99CH_1A5 TaxID=1276529 RepID=A0A1Y6LHQ6_ZYMTR|nr:unnamed protein product [Zymoseptoria tritici ST99CH_1A5]